MADKKRGTKLTDFNHRVRHLDILDIQLVKLAVIAFVFLVLKIWPSIMRWVNNTSVWWFFAALVLFGARPFYRCWVKG